MLLKLENIAAGYKDTKVLFGVSLEVNQSEVVALLGSNGAGKTTLLRVISGLIPVQRGKVYWNGEDITNMPAHRRADAGICQIPQNRGILVGLSVKDNLIMGTYNSRTKPKRQQLYEEIVEIFPILKERLNQDAGKLSGGQQQMLAIARALMMEPKLLVLDEPSLGLAPIVVDEVFGIIKSIKDKGASMLLIEQNLLQALGVSDRGYVMETGKIDIEGTSEDLMVNEDIKKAYLGI